MVSRLLLGRLGLLMSLVYLVSCAPTRPPQPTEEEALTYLQLDVTAPTPSTPVSRCEIDVYLDASQSMIGYLSPKKSAYRNTLDTILGNLSGSNVSANVYPFGLDVGAPLGPDSRYPLNWRFYSQEFTSLPAVLRHLSDGLHNSHLSIIISDLVQSGQADDHKAVSSALGTALQQYRSLGAEPEVDLLGFRSAFYGKYSIEAHDKLPRKLDPLDRLDDPESGRPFYVWVLSPSAEVLNSCREYALRGTNPLKQFSTLSPLLSVAQIQLADELLDGGGPYQIWDRTTVTPLAHHQRMISVVQAKKGSIHSQDPLGAALSGDLGISPINFARIGISGKRCELSVNNGLVGCVPTELLAKEHPVVSLRPDEPLIVQFPIGAPRAASWGLWYYKFMPGNGNLNVPSWVADWSTTDDRTMDNASKTLHIETLVRAMITHVVEPRPFLEQVLIVRGE